MLLLLAPTYWIDVCQNNGNLLALDSDRKKLNIIDKRESKVVRTFDGIHLGKIL